MKAQIFYNKHSKQIAIVPEMGNGVIYEKYGTEVTGVTIVRSRIETEAGWRVVIKEIEI